MRKRLVISVGAVAAAIGIVFVVFGIIRFGPYIYLGFTGEFDSCGERVEWKEKAFAALPEVIPPEATNVEIEYRSVGQCVDPFGPNAFFDMKGNFGDMYRAVERQAQSSGWKLEPNGCLSKKFDSVAVVLEAEKLSSYRDWGIAVGKLSNWNPNGKDKCQFPTTDIE